MSTHIHYLKDSCSRMLSAYLTSRRVDLVEEILTEAERKLHQETGMSLNWDTSVVDLMKLLELDSSYEARLELAHQLGYQNPQWAGFVSGDELSTYRNNWLRAKIMDTLADSL